jgi:galactosamine-6-phosphate isomerase
MNITYCQNYDQMSLMASTMVIDEVSRKSNSLICTATGNSPTGLYKLLSKQAIKNKNLFSKVRVIKLDEWGGVPIDDGITCESYLKENVLVPLEIEPNRYFSFNSNPTNPSEECGRMQAALEQNGPIDICILGLGINGHIGFNEPASFLKLNCHQADLSKQSLLHNMIQAAIEKPRYGLTLGLKNILDSKKVIMLITGKGKQQVTKEFLAQKITPQLPASFLWLHDHVECLIDETIS